MAAKTYAELLAAPTAATEKERVLAKLRTAEANGGFPVTSWPEGGMARTLVEAEADGLVEARGLIANIAKGGLTEDAAGDWLKRRAKQVYDLDYDPATQTVGTIALYVATGSGPYTIAANQLWFEGEGGNRYNSTSTGTLAAVGFSAVTQVGGGAGTVTPLNPSGSVPTGYQTANANGKSYKIEIVTGGGLGTATYKLSLDGGATYGRTKTTPGGGTTTDDPETGVRMTFASTFSGGTTYAWTAGGQLNTTVRSEFVNDSANGRNYIDANSTITRMLTPLPGVTAKNFPAIFSSVTKSGTGTGVVEARPKSYAAVTAASVNIEITLNGQIGTAKFRYQIDGGAFSSEFTTPTVSAPELTRAVYNDATLDGKNIELWFSNGSANPSFADGDFYAVAAPASWITTQGTDEQNDPSLRAECRNRWSTLSPITTNPLYEVWSKAASNQVTIARVDLDTAVNNKVQIRLAGQAGAVDPAVATAVDAYVRARMPITDRVNVASAAPQAVTLAGATVRVKATNLARAQTKAQQNVTNYIAAVGIGDGSTVKVTHAQIIEAILRESGAEGDNVTGLTINGSTNDLTVTANSIPTFSQTLSSALTWTTY